MGSVPKFSLEMCEQIRADYDSGDSTPILSDRYRADPVTICKAIRRAGGKLRTVGGSVAGWKKRRADPDYQAEVAVVDTRPHGAKHIPALDYRASRAERAAAQLNSYFSNEEGRR